MNTVQQIIPYLLGGFIVAEGNVQSEHSAKIVQAGENSYQIAEHIADKDDREDQIFTAAFNRIHRVVTFNMAWKNETGYLNGIIGNSHRKPENDNSILITLDETHAQSNRICVVPGEQVKGVDDFGRRFIYTATRLGGIVVFDRYKLDTDSTKVFVLNKTDGLWLMPGIPNSACSIEELTLVLGSDDYNNTPNIGTTLENIFKESLEQTQAMLSL